MEQTTQDMKKYCDQCGAVARPQARFCGGCGFDMSAMPRPAMQPMASSGQEFQQDAVEGKASTSMGLGMAWLIYLGAMLLWLFFALFMPNIAVNRFITLLLYVGFGFVMTRYVMRDLIEFHPMYNTVANVFSAKIWMFLLWPIQMFILLFKLTVNGAL
ncbi:MAG: hypothetical protein ACREBY_13835 [Polaromonas sp.]